jgi:hypothetical protein
MKKEFAEMGIPNLQDLNLCLIGSWIKRYIQGEGALWTKVIDAKYNTRNPNILSCQDVHTSIFWKGVMWASMAIAIGMGGRSGWAGGAVAHPEILDAFFYLLRCG